MRDVAKTMAALTACAVILTGCGTKSDGDETSTAASDIGPLDEYLGWGDYSFSDEDQADFNAQMRAQQETIASCMADQGFTYIPVDYSSQTSWSDTSDDIDYNSREYAEKYGYGLTSWLDEETQVDPETAATEEAWTDPNDEAISAMSESERQAYYEALWGNSPLDRGDYPADMDSDQGYSQYYNSDGSATIEYTTVDGGTGSLKVPAEDVGCQGKADYAMQQEYFGDVSMEEFNDLNQAMSDIYANMTDDPRYSELNHKWAACMADAGYSDVPESPDGMWNYASDLLDKATSGDDVDYEATAREFRQTEIEIALADYDCRQDVEYDAESKKIRDQLEQEFIDTHKAELDAYKAALAQAEEARTAKATESAD